MLSSRALPMLCVDERGCVSELSMSVSRLQEESRVSMRELLSVEQPLSSSTQPRIMPRRHCILFHLGAARGIIFANRAYLFLQPRLSSVAPRGVAAGLAEHIKAASAAAAVRTAAAASGADVGVGVSATPPPFEFVALEYALFAMASRQEKRVAYAGRVLEAMLTGSRAATLDDSRLFTLLPLTTSLQHYESVSRGLMDCVRALLDDARDMREACLTEKAAHAQAVRTRAHALAAGMAAAYLGNGSATAHEAVMATAVAADACAEDASAFLGLRAPSPISTHEALRRVISEERLPAAVLARGNEPSGISSLSPMPPSSPSQPATAAEAAAVASQPQQPQMSQQLTALPAPGPVLDEEDVADDAAMHPAAAAAASSQQYAAASIDGGSGGGGIAGFPSGSSWRGGGSVACATPPTTSGASASAASPMPDISHDTLSMLELMLESVHHSAAGSTIAAVNMSRSLAVKRELLQLQQRAYQNSVLSISLRTSQASMALACATWCTSLAGQNLPSGFENVAGAFAVATGISALVGVAVYAGAVRLAGRPGASDSPRRLETLQTFLLQLDQRLDAARETLATAAATLAQRSGGGVNFDAGTAAAAAAAAAASATMSRAEFKALHQATAGASAGESHLLFDLLSNGGSELRLADVMSLSSRIESYHLASAVTPVMLPTK